ncbi:MAG: DUF1501 domain-containing protein [Pirellulaceae bacterium]
MKKHRDGIRRRDFLRIGGSVCGLSLVDLLRLEAAQDAVERSAKSAIFIFLCGGQSHLDTWDMKPENSEVGGEFKPIPTNLPGLSVCELMPKLAQQADKYTVLRNVSHTQGVHGPGQLYVRTGNKTLPSMQFPDHGCVVSKELTTPQGIPPSISLPVVRSNGVIEQAGYLGVAYKSFTVREDPNSPGFSVRALTPPDGLSRERIGRRINFMNRIDRGLRTTDANSQEMAGMDQFYSKAVDILNSVELRRAFDLTGEDDKTRDLYGRHHFGQACLLARRLVAAGVRFVSIDFGGWDTHQGNFVALKNQLVPPWDEGLAALLADLNERGMLDSTLVWSTGEFGRTPKINNQNAGRDHWPRANSMLLAGGGVARGKIIGETDKEGAEPLGESCTPDDVAASFYHAMGIDYQREYYTPDGRPVLLVRDGRPISDLFAG